MMEDFKRALDYHLGKIVCVKITMPGSPLLDHPSSDLMHVGINFSKVSVSNYSSLVNMEKYLKMIPKDVS